MLDCRGLAALRTMMMNNRVADPKRFAHIRQELGIGPQVASNVLIKLQMNSLHGPQKGCKKYLFNQPCGRGEQELSRRSTWRIHKFRFVPYTRIIPCFFPSCLRPAALDGRVPRNCGMSSTRCSISPRPAAIGGNYQKSFPLIRLSRVTFTNGCGMDDGR